VNNGRHLIIRKCLPKSFFAVLLTIIIGNICMEAAMDQTIIGSNRKIDPNRRAHLKADLRLA